MKTERIILCSLVRWRKTGSLSSLRRRKGYPFLRYAHTRKWVIAPHKVRGYKKAWLSVQK